MWINIGLKEKREDIEHKVITYEELLEISDDEN